MLSKSKRLTIEIWAIAVIAIGAFAIIQPGITGYISTDAYKQSLNLVVAESQEFTLTSSVPLQMTSLSVTGKIEGDGAAEIYLIIDNKQYLVHSNWAPRVKNSITGRVTNPLLLREGDTIDETPETPENAAAQPGGFTDSCIQTCFLKGIYSGNYKLKVLVDPGVTLYLDTLTYTTPE